MRPPLTERDREVLRMLVATCDPDVLADNLGRDVDPGELDDLLERLTP
jgi:hypothetical protein